MPAKPVGIGRAGNGCLQHAIVPLYGHQHIDKEREEQQIAIGIAPRRQERAARVGAKRPVAVLARSIDPGKWLFMEQHDEPMLAGDGVHQVHHQLILVVRKIGVAIDGRHLELIGSHLVMPGLQRNAQAQAFDFQFAHERCDTGWNRTEIVVVQLLVFRRHMPHQRPAGYHEVGAGSIQVFIHQEILLLPAQIAVDLVHGGVEEAADGYRSAGNGPDGPLQRRLVVKRLACVSDKNSRDAERIFLDKNG